MARFTYPVGSGGAGDTADFIFINEDSDNSKITLPVNKELTIETTRDDDDDADINIRSADDVFITALGDDVRLDAFNEVSISTDDDNYEWTFNNSGCIQLPGSGEICNPENSSGDGIGYSTVQIKPAGTGDDRYIVLDPTVPNHIHIRAGGNIDSSSAELILGGEKANVSVFDGSHEVGINSYDSEGDNYYNWTFRNDGTLLGPSGGQLKIDGIDGGASGSFTTVDGKVVTVTNGIITAIDLV